jgi:hypothetical protein
MLERRDSRGRERWITRKLHALNSKSQHIASSCISAEEFEERQTYSLYSGGFRVELRGRHGERKVARLHSINGYTPVNGCLIVQHIRSNGNLCFDSTL